MVQRNKGREREGQKEHNRQTRKKFKKDVKRK
jgi:hypothetical protein